MARHTFTFRKRGCHDCELLGLCGDPRADGRSDYCCPQWQWRYG